MDFKIHRSPKITDERGELVVFLNNSSLNENHKQFGQIYFVSFNKKGVVRGNHYHKEWIEWFGIVHGSVEVYLEDINTKEKKHLILSESSSDYERLEIGPNIAHTFISLSEGASLLNYTSTEWYPNDTFEYIIKK